MSTLPIHCHNCLSQQREFFVYLQCKHFLCMSCCLFMANLQTLTVRCCHRNTKMSQQLVRTIFEEIQTRKTLKEMGQISTETFINDFNLRIDPNSLISHQLNEELKYIDPDIVFNRTRDQVLKQSKVVSSLLQSMETKDVSDKVGKLYQKSKEKQYQKSKEKQYLTQKTKQHLTQKAKQIEVQQSKPDKKSKQKQYKEQKEKQKQKQKQKQKESEKKDEHNRNENFNKPTQRIEQFDPLSYSIMKQQGISYFQTAPHQAAETQYQSPTFKEIKLKTDSKINQFTNEFTSRSQVKQNYQYWKNYDSTKDRILAKLNHHQFKMKALIKEHYYG